MPEGPVTSVDVDEAVHRHSSAAASPLRLRTRLEEAVARMAARHPAWPWTMIVAAARRQAMRPLGGRFAWLGGEAVRRLQISGLDAGQLDAHGARANHPAFTHHRPAPVEDEIQVQAEDKPRPARDHEAAL